MYEVRSIEITKREITKNGNWGVIRAAASSLAIDTYGTIVWFAPVNWNNRMYQFRVWRNRLQVPMLYKHGLNLWRDDRPIGIVNNFTISGDGKSADTELLVDYRFDLVDPFSKEIFGQYEREVYTDFSVGMERDWIELSGEEANNFLEEQGRPERGVTILLSPQFMEVSSGVTWGSNPDSSILSASVEADIRKMIGTEKTSHDEIIKRIEALEQTLAGAEIRPTRKSEGLKRFLKNRSI